MNQQHPIVADPLLAGFFTIGTAARLVGASQASIRGWLDGYPGSAAGPVLRRDFDATRTVSFLDLIELRFIAFFRARNVPMSTLRKAAAAARDSWNVSHPLALASEHYVTDRRKIFSKVAQEEGDPTTLDLSTGQFEMWETIEQTIEKGVVFDAKTYLAQLWYPKPRAFPEVVIDPHVAFGQPTIEGANVPTANLFRQWLAEGSKEQVARWFDVSVEAVTIAIEYELEAA